MIDLADPFPVTDRRASQLADPVSVAEARALQLAEVRGLNRRLELANRDLGRELHSARTRLEQLEAQLAEERARAQYRVGQLEQELREARAFRRRWRYRFVDRCVWLFTGLPVLISLLRLLRRSVGAALRTEDQVTG